MLNRSSSKKGCQLITFPPSIDSETGRWILDAYGFAYEEERHAIPFVAGYIAWYRSPVPILLQSGKVLSAGPRPLFEHFEPLATPETCLSPREPDAERLVQQAWDQYNQRLGWGSARWAYTYLLEVPELAIETISRGAPKKEIAFNRKAYPLIASGLRAALSLEAAKTQTFLSTVLQVFADVERQLSDGRRYLGGERFSLLDLSFAVAAAPMVLPAEYGGPLPDFGDLPSAMKPVVRECQKSVAGRHCLRMYEAHRGVRPARAESSSPGEGIPVSKGSLAESS